MDEPSQPAADPPKWYGYIAGMAIFALVSNILGFGLIYLAGPVLIKAESRILCMSVLGVAIIALILGFFASRLHRFHTSAMILSLSFALTAGWVYLLVDAVMTCLNSFEKYKLC